MSRTLRLMSAAAASVLLLAACPNPLMDAVKAKVARDEGKGIETFSFTMAKNPKLYRDVPGAVDASARTISLVVPKWVPLTGLVASFQFEGAAVTVNGVQQASGVTPNDFSAPVTYTVTPVVGDPVAYTVTATSSAQGLRGGSIQGVMLSLAGNVDTVAGQASIFGDPAGCVAVGTFIYVADYAYHVIWRILNTSPYTATIFAGKLGEPGFADAPSGPATSATFNYPWGLASDGTSLYVADSGNSSIRKVEIATGYVTTLTSGFSAPMGLSYYAAGSLLYATDVSTGGVCSINMTGTVTTLLSIPYTTGYEWPVAIVRDASNRLYIADQGVNTIWQVDVSGPGPYSATALAGSGSDIYGGWNNNIGTAARFYYPSGLAISGSQLLVADLYNNEIRTVDLPPLSPNVGTYAGSHLQAGTRDGLLSAMLLYSPQGIAVSGSTVYIAETGNKLLRKVQSGTTSSIAGTAPGSANGVGSAARFYIPRLMTTDGASIWIVDGFNHTVRSLDPATRVVGTLAGMVQANLSVIDETDGPASSALFSYPSGVTQVGSCLYVCDNVASTIRKLDLVTGQVTTFAGSKFSPGYSDGIGTLASFDYPTGITNDGTYLYVTDYNNQTIRRIEIATANVVTIAGSPGQIGNLDDSSPAGGIAANARFRYPFGITTDGTSLFIADRSNHRIRKIEIATGAVSTFAGPGPGTSGIGYKNLNGNNARFRSPRGITTDGTYLYVADSMNHVIRRITIATRDVDTVAGPAPEAVMAGEVDGLGTAARFNFPNGITTDGTALYVSDINGNTIRRIR
jgi:hypothetical protein